MRPAAVMRGGGWGGNVRLTRTRPCFTPCATILGCVARSSVVDSASAAPAASGLGPYSRMAGLLLFPLRPFRRNRLSAMTGFRFQWRRNRFACPNVLLWRFSG